MPSSGARFGRYELRERLGAGGMGEVYRARDSELQRDVAIKFLSDPFVTDPTRLARFAAEARAASALNHPNILTVHDIGESAGQPFIVMECVKGQTLRELIGPKGLAPKAMLDIGVQIADGLAKAHAAGIVHRDLKPENVMVTADGLVKIVDFGLARPPVFGDEAGAAEAETRAETPTMHGAILGTVGYMAPEQARGETVDHRADQFALGAILYEMATGRRAFRCPSAVETLAATLDREPEPITALSPAFPAPARWLIERCLSKQPRQRYASTEDLAHELRTVREHLIEASASLSGPGPTPPRRRAPVWRTAVLVALILIGAALASPLRTWLWGWVAGPPWPDQQRVVVLPIEREGDVDDVVSGLLGYVVMRLGQLNGVDGRISVVPASEVIMAGVQNPSAARKKLGATIAVTISVIREGPGVVVNVALADAERVSALGGDSITLTGTKPAREAIVGLVVRVLKVQLQPDKKALWESGLTANVHAETLFAQGLTPFQQASIALQHYEQEEALTEAIRLFNKAVDNDRGYAAAWAALGEAYLRLYRLKEDTALLEPAEKALRSALDLDRTRPSVWISLGMLLVAKGEAQEAERTFQRVIAINPAGADAYRELGYAYQRTGQLQKAEPQVPGRRSSSNRTRGRTTATWGSFATRRRDSARPRANSKRASGSPLRTPGSGPISGAST